MATHEVEVPVLALDRLAPVIGQERVQAVQSQAGRIVARLGERRVWQVNSTATGGGVAEMLPVLVGYARASGADVRWVVIDGDPEFFAITKRLHNRVHGAAGDGGALGDAELAHYAQITDANARSLLERVDPGDVVVLHDPQTAGLVAPLQAAGVGVIWRSHIGADRENDHTREAWRFLRPLVEGADTLVFSRAAYVPDWVPASKSAVIPPSIDPLSPKNRELTAVESAEILGRVGLFDGAFTPDAPLVVQVSRWDRLKDMPGVMRGFVDHLSTASDAVLALVGPDVSGVSDDPEGHAVYVECTDVWESLPSGQRARVRLISLPVDDVDANAEMVNAIQRHASVVVQKSLAEGFGLTVSEGMWKSRPVIGSAVGGIPDQIAPGTGLLLDDPTDLDTFGRELRDLLGDEARMASMGAAAHEHIRANFVGDAHLLRWIAVVDRLLD